MRSSLAANGRVFRRATFLVLLLGVLLRLTLAVVNREANDDHLPVIWVMAYQNRIPAKEETKEAFQPKLYHATVAALWRVVPKATPAARIQMAQMVSCVAGIATLFVALRLLDAMRSSAKVRFLSFALVALNPALVGINAQATNDSFVILFASLSLYFGLRFFHTPGWRDLCWMTVSAVLAGLSKGNGLVVAMVIVSLFAVALVRGPDGCGLRRRDSLRFGLVFLVLFFAVVPRLGTYWQLYRRYGLPFVTNSRPAPMPFFLDRTFSRRPGVTSLADALLTFRFFDMLRNPVITNGLSDYPLHRTSLWSQLYGRTHFVHFEAWPPSWESRTPLVLGVGRLLLLLALFPTALLLTAIGRGLVAGFRRMTAARPAPVQLAEWLLWFSVAGYVAFVTAYALRYRDFACMKAIFLFPGLPGFLILFARECDRYYGWCRRLRVARFSADTLFGCLLVCYTVDVVILIDHLSARLLPR